MTTTTNITTYLETRRAIAALRDEQFSILMSIRRDMDRYRSIETEIQALKKLIWSRES